MAQHAPWQNRLIRKVIFSDSLSVETTPFVLRNRLYRLENVPKSKEFPFEIPQYRFHEDEIRVRDVEEDRIVSVVLRNHYFGSAFVWDGRVHVFAGDYGEDEPWWHIRRIVMTSSDDLVHWTEPVTVIESENGERLFNTAVCRGADSFVLLYETNDARWPPPFTFKYCTSDDLLHWTRIPDAVYGRGKYVGGPALYFEGGTYYTLYLQALDGGYETRITRSRDLRNWEDAPADRPVLPFNPEFVPQPDLFPDVREISASDAKLCAWQGKTLVYFYGGNQQGQGALQAAEFDGRPWELLEHYFATEIEYHDPCDPVAESEWDACK
ncbi:MAG: glycoside hydrolase family protein [Armatimonadota bacterium]